MVCGAHMIRGLGEAANMDWVAASIVPAKVQPEAEANICLLPNISRICSLAAPESSFLIASRFASHIGGSLLASQRLFASCSIALYTAHGGRVL